MGGHRHRHVGIHVFTLFLITSSRESTTTWCVRYCGGCLSPLDGAEAGASVYSRISSSVFWIQFITGRPAADSGPQAAAKHGPGCRQGKQKRQANSVGGYTKFKHGRQRNIIYTELYCTFYSLFFFLHLFLGIPSYLGNAIELQENGKCKEARMGLKKRQLHEMPCMDMF